MTRNHALDYLAPLPISEASSDDIEVAFNFAGYHDLVDRRPTGITLRHETGSTVTALFDVAACEFTSVTATTPVSLDGDPDQVATIAFTRATPLGVVLAALLSPQWTAKCAEASCDQVEWRRARIHELRTELARLEAATAGQ